jgi:hypothetical protein
MGLLRSLDHNDEPIVWAEQTEIELGNFLREFDATGWPVFQRHGYTKDTAVLYWRLSQALGELAEIESLLRDERESL